MEFGTSHCKQSMLQGVLGMRVSFVTRDIQRTYNMSNEYVYKRNIHFRVSNTFFF